MNTKIMTNDELITKMKKIVDETVKRNKKDFEYDKNWLKCGFMHNDRVSFLWIVREGGTHVKEFLLGGGPEYCEFMHDLANTGTEKFYYVTCYGEENIIRELTREQAEKKIDTFIDFIKI